MEQQLPLFARELAPTDQQTIRTALTLLNVSYANLARHLPPAMPSVTGCVRSLLHWRTKYLPSCGSITSIVSSLTTHCFWAPSTASPYTRVKLLKPV